MQSSQQLDRLIGKHLKKLNLSPHPKQWYKKTFEEYTGKKASGNPQKDLRREIVKGEINAKHDNVEGMKRQIQTGEGLYTGNLGASDGISGGGLPKRKSVRKHVKQPIEMQALLFNREMDWTKPKVNKWLKGHQEYPIKKLHSTKKYIRARMMEPDRERFRYRTENLSKEGDIKVIWAIPKARRAVGKGIEDIVEWVQNAIHETRQAFFSGVTDPNVIRPIISHNADLLTSFSPTNEQQRRMVTNVLWLSTNLINRITNPTIRNELMEMLQQFR